MKVYVNGTISSSNDAQILPSDRGMTLGDGLFETLRAENGLPVRLNAHMDRLRKGADLLGLPTPLEDGPMGDAISETLKANGLSDGIVRVTYTRGPAARGLLPTEPQTPTLVISASEPTGDLPPVHAIVSDCTRRNEFSPLSACKTTNVLDNVLARQEAQAAGANDAILLNTHGLMAETTISNIFIVLDGNILTPHESDGALPGIMRAEVIGRTDTKARSLTVEELYTASEAFTTNSLGIRPLVQLGERRIGNGKTGKITKELMAVLP